MMTATYSPDDNKLRLYSVGRLDAETYPRVRAAGFRWAPKQELWVAPAWSPEREDLLIELCGEVGDEDTSLVDRAEERAERFDGYEERRRDEAHAAREAVSRIADGIPLGQPILVGHHSEKHARKDAERIENGMRRAVNLWKTADYWRGRAAGALRHAKYKELPAVRARRIKGLEADARKMRAGIARAERLIQGWARPETVWRREGQPVGPELTRALAVMIANQDGGYFTREHTYASGHVGPLSLWEAVGGNIDKADPELRAVASVAAVRDRAVANHEDTIARLSRWLEHYERRLDYERAMLDAAGGTVADQTTPEKGGAVRCWVGGRGAWLWIVKVNKVSVSVHDQWNEGDRLFARTVPFDKLRAVMSAAGVAAAREAGRIRELTNKTGFILLDADGPEPEKPSAPEPEPDSAPFDALADSLRAGVQVVSAPALFPTPANVARRLVQLATIKRCDRVLEPSAGTGRLVDALIERAGDDEPRAGWITAVERSHSLAEGLRVRYREDARVAVVCADFLEWAATTAERFEAIVMNPPFTDGADIKHIRAAAELLVPGGRLVAICAAGPRQREAFDFHDELEPGTFEGTNVRAAIVVLDAPDPHPDDREVGAGPVPEPENGDEGWTSGDCGVSGCVHDTPAAALACHEAASEWKPGTGLLF